ncbi:MAG: hypothetical protein ACRCYS_18580 [Beijerinckiaceae bacterium]
MKMRNAFPLYFRRVLAVTLIATFLYFIALFSMRQYSGTILAVVVFVHIFLAYKYLVKTKLRIVFEWSSAVLILIALGVAILALRTHVNYLDSPKSLFGAIRISIAGCTLFSASVAMLLSAAFRPSQISVSGDEK